MPGTNLALISVDFQRFLAEPHVSHKGEEVGEITIF